MIKLLLLITIIVGSFVSGCNSSINKRYLNMNLKKDLLVYKGAVRYLPKANPWEIQKLEYTDQRGGIYTSEVPLNSDIMGMILNSSNFVHTEQMMEEVASIFFQNANSLCPDGSGFPTTNIDDSIISKIKIVDRDGVVWDLEVFTKLNKHSFIPRKTKKIYPDLEIVG